MGTILYQTCGRAVPFGVDALTYVVSLTSLLAMRTVFKRESTPVKQALLGEISAS